MIGTLEKELEITGSLSPTLSLEGVLQKNLQITGVLSSELNISASIEEIDGKITGNLSNFLQVSGSLAKQYEISGNISVPIIQYTEEDYQGEYFVIPLAEQQTILQTEGKRLYNNVTIDKIPYYQTTNLSGGYTVYIGGE